jgi:hypothetical protein
MKKAISDLAESIEAEKKELKKDNGKYSKGTSGALRKTATDAVAAGGNNEKPGKVAAAAKADKNKKEKDSGLSEEDIELIDKKIQKEDEHIKLQEQSNEQSEEANKIAADTK